MEHALEHDPVRGSDSGLLLLLLFRLYLSSTSLRTSIEAETSLCDHLTSQRFTSIFSSPLSLQEMLRTRRAKWIFVLVSLPDFALELYEGRAGLDVREVFLSEGGEL